MAIPFKVNLRGLFVRKVSTVTTVVCLALVVAVFSAMMALANGLEYTLRSTGDPLNVIAMRDGATSEMNSFVSIDQYQVLKTIPGVAAAADGKPAVAGEVVIVINKNKRGSEEGANVVIRGVTPAAFVNHPEVKIVEGRTFQPGQAELIASRSIAKKFDHCGLGETLSLKKRDLKIVGIFEAGSTAHGSEIWGDEIVIRDLFNRPGYSVALLRAQDASAVGTIQTAVKNDQRLKLSAISEKEYFAQQTRQAEPIRIVGQFLALILAIGAAFAAANTMYAAVSSRGREIATLRALGFSRGSILMAYLGEALVLGLLGGVVGIAVAYLAVNGVTTGTANWVTFSELSFAFRVTPVLVAIAITFASVIGALGGLLPARLAARAPITQGLRQL